MDQKMKIAAAVLLVIVVAFCIISPAAGQDLVAGILALGFLALVIKGAGKLSGWSKKQFERHPPKKS